MATIQTATEVKLTDKQTKELRKFKRVFKSSFPSHSYIFGSHKDSIEAGLNGKAAHFINHEYITDHPQEIIELEQQIKLGHPHIYIDESKKEVEINPEDPVAVIKRKAIEDYIKEQEKLATNPNRDMGATEQTGKVGGIGNSQTIAPAASGSSSGANAAVLANLRATAGK